MNTVMRAQKVGFAQAAWEKVRIRIGCVDPISFTHRSLLLAEH